MQMSDFKYDEDISENRMFIKLKQDNKILMETAAMEKWIICIPRNESLQESDFFQTDFVLSHILIPNDELPEFYFTTLIGDNYELRDQMLISKTTRERRQILFEETFYTEDFYKIRVWCISFPLTITCKNLYDLKTVTTVEEASQFLLQETNSPAILKVISNICLHHVRENFQNELVDNLREKVETLIGKCFKLIMSRKNLRDKFNSDVNKMCTLKNALALWISSTIYEVTFDAVSTVCAEKNEKFNKAMREMSLLTAGDLKIPERYHSALIPVKHQFSAISSYKSPLGKIYCLRKAIDKLNINSNSPVVDDLIPIFVYAIVKSGYTHWVPTVYYINEFLNLFQNYNQNSLENYLLTTLEAAMYFIISYKPVNPVVEKTDQYKNEYKTKKEFLDTLFKLVKANDELGVLKLFNVNVTNEDELFTSLLEKRKIDNNALIGDNASLCHPLCDCPSCKEKIANSTPDINAPDDHGRTALHIAAENGFSIMINVLLSLGSDVNRADNRGYTPLHCAAARGHQNVLLLLLHFNANINSITNDGFSPLILASLNGHSGCVKALLFYSDHIKVNHDINQKDIHGNSALHLASKWGYKDIVESLLEYGADANVLDNAGNSPICVAHNSHIRQHLKTFSDKDLNATNQAQMQQQPHKTEATINQIFSAITNNDVKLLCYYLGMDSNTDKPPTPAVTKRINSIQNGQGATLLQYAAMLNYPTIIESLLLNGAKPEAQNRFGQTALHIACKQNNMHAISSLLQFSTSHIIDIQDKKGNTVMHYAAAAVAFDMVQLLLQHYPNLELKNNENLRPIEVALKYDAQNIYNLLKRAMLQ